jgi:nitrogen regulatory protein PII 2
LKEIMAVIRMNKINQTKEALLKEGFTALTCRKVLGRGKKKIDLPVFHDLMSEQVMLDRKVAESLTENHRLIPKRALTFVVRDEDVKKAVNILIATNQTGTVGDGKIFVLPVKDAIRVRTMECGLEAL